MSLDSSPTRTSADLDRSGGALHPDPIGERRHAWATRPLPWVLAALVLCSTSLIATLAAGAWQPSSGHALCLIAEATACVVAVLSLFNAARHSSEPKRRALLAGAISVAVGGVAVLASGFGAPAWITLTGLTTSAACGLAASRRTLGVTGARHPRFEVAGVAFALSGPGVALTLAIVSSRVSGLAEVDRASILWLLPTWFAGAVAVAAALVSRVCRPAVRAAPIRSLLWSLLLAVLTFEIGLTGMTDRPPAPWLGVAFVAGMTIPTLSAVRPTPDFRPGGLKMSLEDLRSRWATPLLVATTTSVLVLMFNTSRPVGTLLAQLAGVSTVIGVALLAATVRTHRRTARQLARRVNELESREVELVVARDTAERARDAQQAFLSRTSHELRTPLHAILGYSELMSFTSDLTVRRYSDHVTSAGKRLNSIVDDLLELNNVELGTVAYTIDEVPVCDVVEKVLEEMNYPGSTGEVQERTLVDLEKTVTVLADEQRLQQVLVNLISNASKYTAGPIEITAATAHDAALITVADHGTGLSDDELAEAFTPFARLGQECTDQSGFGLGLPISRALCEGMNGTLVAERRSDAGTQFTIRLPAPQMSGGIERTAPGRASD